MERNSVPKEPLLGNNQYYPYRVEYEDVKVRADEIGKSEQAYNYYQRVLDTYKDFEDEGLHPVIFSDPTNGNLYLTSQENIDNKLH